MPTFTHFHEHISELLGWCLQCYISYLEGLTEVSQDDWSIGMALLQVSSVSEPDGPKVRLVTEGILGPW